MSKFYIIGTYSDQALSGFIKNPNDDRSAVIGGMVSSMGGNLFLFDIVRGHADFIAGFDGIDFEKLASMKIAVQSTGMIKEFTVLETLDMNKVAAGANEALSRYRKPGE